MKKVFLSTALAVAAVAFSAASAQAAVVCTAGVVDVTTLNAGGGCTVGAYLFNNFQVSVGQVGITGVNNPGIGGVGLNFNPNLINSAVLNDIHFLFSVTGPVDSVYLYNGATIGAGGASSIGERICTVGVNLSGLCSGSQLLNLNADANQQNSGSFAVQTTIWVWKDINITGDAHLSSFDQNFSAVPEPATLSLMGLGLVGLGLVSRRKKS